MKKRLRPPRSRRAPRSERRSWEERSLRSRQQSRLDLADIDGESARPWSGEPQPTTRSGGRSPARGAARRASPRRGGLADAAGKREAAIAALYRLKSAGERLELRRESAAGLRRVGCASPRAGPGFRRGPSAAELRRRKLREEAGLARASGLLRSSGRLPSEGVPPAARARRSRSRASKLEVAPGDERCRRGLRGCGAAVVAPDEQTALRLVDEARAGGLGASTWSSTRPSTNSSSSSATNSRGSRLLAVTRDGTATTRRRGSCGSARLRKRCCLKLEARRRAVAAEVEELERRRSRRGRAR